MQKRWQIFVIKLQLSLSTTARILSNWRYSLLAIISASVFLVVLYWLLNLSLLWYLLGSGALSLIDKISLIINSTLTYLTGASVLQATATVTLVIGQGVVIAMLVFIARTQNKIDAKAFGGSTIASIIAIFSVGCVSCGTSIIAPVISLFVSGATAGISQKINSYAVYVSLALVLYALYSVGVTAANYLARSDTLAGNTFIS